MDGGLNMKNHQILNEKLANLYFPTIFRVNKFNDNSAIHIEYSHNGEIVKKIFNACEVWNDIMPICQSLGVEMNKIDGFYHSKTTGGKYIARHKAGIDERVARVEACIMVLERWG